VQGTCISILLAAHLNKARASPCACTHAQDPTGAVGAGVTARGMDAQPGLAPGAAVLLRDVAVLRLGRVPYLAITPANVVKVLPQVNHKTCRAWAHASV